MAAVPKDQTDCGPACAGILALLHAWHQRDVVAARDRFSGKHLRADWQAVTEDRPGGSISGDARRSR